MTFQKKDTFYFSHEKKNIADFWKSNDKEQRKIPFLVFIPRENI